VSVFAGCIAFLEAIVSSLQGRKRHSEISGSAPHVGVNYLAPMSLQPEKVDDKTLLPFIYQCIIN
jgi:hypothetical protein